MKRSRGLRNEKSEFLGKYAVDLIIDISAGIGQLSKRFDAVSVSRRLIKIISPVELAIRGLRLEALPFPWFRDKDGTMYKIKGNEKLWDAVTGLRGQHLVWRSSLATCKILGLPVRMDLVTNTPDELGRAEKLALDWGFQRGRKLLLLNFYGVTQEDLLNPGLCVHITKTLAHNLEDAQVLLVYGDSQDPTALPINSIYHQVAAQIQSGVLILPSQPQGLKELHLLFGLAASTGGGVVSLDTAISHYASTYQNVFIGVISRSQDNWYTWGSLHENAMPIFIEELDAGIETFRR